MESARKPSRRHALEPLVRNAWDVKVVGGEEEEERRVLLRFDEGVGFLHPLVGEILVAEAGGLATGVEPDAADAVVDGAVVAVRPVHLEGVAVRLARRVVGRWDLVPDPERVGGVEVQDAVIFEINLRDAVVRSGKEEGRVEADLQRPGLELAIPLRTLAFLAEAEVPLAHDGGGIARRLHQVRQCGRVRVNDEWPFGGAIPVPFSRKA